MRLIGLAGWSGAGKTTLIARIIPHFRARGLRISTLKHAHHEFDLDIPGKDSWRHRQAGATEVIISSARRWAQIHELRDAPEPALPELLARLSPVDLVIVEGFKFSAHAKVEVHRTANGRPFLYPDDPHILGLVTDVVPQDAPPCAALDDVDAIADLLLKSAQPLAALKS
ncbi:molybdopterin-guanine dinucleotide biosynthesis protein B [Rhodoligotrophos appendicifer]|uniref:molybdopterin-guanine dinucleotide biosynthesis protein B n=1 Tax=Rhodoligotrophos appendicifer TaxID=987056 RepID=UPI0011870E63|nr:molybdopterin-guanine dinucleotide biosynthesis protein B [Rhodoligotrophos appendicifer]